VAGSGEHDDKCSGSVKEREFLLTKRAIASTLRPCSMELLHDGYNFICTSFNGALSNISRICLRKLRKTTKALSQDNRCPSRDINLAQVGHVAAGANLLRLTDFSLAHCSQIVGCDPLGG
jgi:hypothetical protein